MMSKRKDPEEKIREERDRCPNNYLKKVSSNKLSQATVTKKIMKNDNFIDLDYKNG